MDKSASFTTRSQEFGSTLRRIRTDHDLSQEKFAELIGVEPRTIQRWESGASFPRPHYTMLIRRLFGDVADDRVEERDVSEIPTSASVPESAVVLSIDHSRENDELEKHQELQRLMEDSLTHFKTIQDQTADILRKQEVMEEWFTQYQATLDTRNLDISSRLAHIDSLKGEEAQTELEKAKQIKQLELRYQNYEILLATLQRVICLALAVWVLLSTGSVINFVILLFAGFVSIREAASVFSWIKKSLSFKG